VQDNCVTVRPVAGLYHDDAMGHKKAIAGAAAIAQVIGWNVR
jgi:hypothetical protein